MSIWPPPWGARERFDALDEELDRICRSISVVFKAVTIVTTRTSRMEAMLKRMERNMKVDLSGLHSDVERNNNVVQAALTCISGLADKLKAAMESEDSTAELKELHDQLTASTDALAAAIAANTPADPAKLEADKQAALANGQG